VDIKRFWDKVNIRGDDECWPWMAAVSGNGYGHIRFEGKDYCSHRIAYELTTGPIPEGLCCLHKCDNKLCINPAHLFLGTRADNQKDMANKGRAAKGERHGASKLTKDQVISIRQEYARDGTSHRKLAARYDVDQANINLIVNRKTWKHI